MGRAPCCDKANVKKGPWSPEEDAKLKEYIDKYGTGGNWIALPQKVGLRRCGKSCRLRWLNYLRPNIKHGEFSDEEDRIIINLFANIGSRWSIIAAQLPGRTDNDIKNYWNTKLKKKLMGIISQQPGDQMRKPHHPLTNNNIISSSSSSPPSSSSYGSHYSLGGPFTTRTAFEPMSSLISAISLSSSTSSANTNTHTNYSTNYGGSSFLQHQVITTPMQHNNSGLIMFGGGDQASCSSSDHNYHNNGVISVVNHDDHEESQKGMISNGSFVNGWGMSDQGSSSVLEYGLEEIKQLISSSSANSSSCNENNNFLFDENKTDQERVLYYYNY